MFKSTKNKEFQICINLLNPSGSTLLTIRFNITKLYMVFTLPLSFDMDMSFTRVLHIEVAYRVPHK
jgi:hypothetical protein